ncbi:MAG: hypothetical protein LUM44_06315 [Pyrinomonadaceae bacterium]|nr:hypothetical protein [Pyrinomonadaceae bacterium]
MILIALQFTDFISLFGNKSKTAFNWFLISLAVGFSISISLLILKYILQKRKNNEVWSRNRNLLHMTLGTSPIPLLLLAMQFSDPDYINYANYGYGALAAVMTYVIIFLFVNLVHKDWRTEIF